MTTSVTISIPPQTNDLLQHLGRDSETVYHGMTVQAERNEILHRINYIVIAELADRHDVMNVDESCCKRSVSLAEIQGEESQTQDPLRLQA